MGMDIHHIWRLLWVRTFSFLSWLLCRFLRWKTFRDEGRLGAYCSVYVAANVPQLVSIPLPIRLCGVSMRKQVNRGALMLVHAIPSNVNYDFAADVRDGLTRGGQKELPSKYLYDDVGSALFEVISHLPEYGLTRADERLLRRH